jgi:hypothetical protein
VDYGLNPKNKPKNRLQGQFQSPKTGLTYLAACIYRGPTPKLWENGGMRVLKMIVAVAIQVGPIGYTDTPMLPGGKWHVHDSGRPQPAAVTPGAVTARPVPPPSDAVVLFDGTSLAKWRTRDGRTPAWTVRGGILEVPPQGTPDGGDIYTVDRFGDCQIHVEWMAPNPPQGEVMNRGNSGVFLFGLYEVQVFDSYKGGIYADGQAAAIYGQSPPLVNASLPPGEWQAFDILFTTPRYDGSKLVSPAYVTVLHNGVAVQNHTEILGDTGHRIFPVYTPAGPRGPVMLQAHGNPVRYRNLWVRNM